MDPYMLASGIVNISYYLMIWAEINIFMHIIAVSLILVEFHFSYRDECFVTVVSLGKDNFFLTSRKQ